MAARTALVSVDRQVAVLAGEINNRQKSVKRGGGMADSTILATTSAANAKVVTGDRHFEGLPDAIII